MQLIIIYCISCIKLVFLFISKRILEVLIAVSVKLNLDKRRIEKSDPPFV